jgi:hypothetical protein
MIRSTLRTLRHGAELRHLPVAIEGSLPVVQTFLVGAAGAFNITGLDVPASLKPFLVGIHETSDWPHADGVRWRFEHRTPDNVLLGSMVLQPAGRIALGGFSFAMFRPSGARTACVRPMQRRWRYLLAWRRSRLRRDALGLTMNYQDLKALDVYYQQPRPVWVVTVPHGADFNLFPMDLLDDIDEDHLFLALRSTSPSVPHMRKLCAIALSAVPAALKPEIYKLGAHHKTAYAPGSPLPVQTVQSVHLGLKVPAPAFQVTEWQISAWTEVGSHTCFLAQRLRSTDIGAGAQLAHVSALFAKSALAHPWSFVEI